MYLLTYLFTYFTEIATRLGGMAAANVRSTAAAAAALSALDDDEDDTTRSMTFLIDDVVAGAASRHHAGRTQSYGILASTHAVNGPDYRLETHPKRHSVDTRGRQQVHPQLTLSVSTPGWSDTAAAGGRPSPRSAETTTIYVDAAGNPLTGLALERAVYRSRQLRSRVAAPADCAPTICHGRTPPEQISVVFVVVNAWLSRDMNL